MILSYLYNAIKKILDEISFHRHFKSYKEFVIIWHSFGKDAVLTLELIYFARLNILWSILMNLSFYVIPL